MRLDFKSGLLAVSILLLSQCGSYIKTELVNKNPPTFRIGGNEDVQFFRVTGPYSEDFKHDPPEVWQIHPAGEYPHVENVSDITYGQVPDGWRQEIPEKGAPPALTEGGIYIVGAISGLNHAGRLYIIIRNGKAEEYNRKETQGR